jgi:hypothetical protein
LLSKYTTHDSCLFDLFKVNFFCGRNKEKLLTKKWELNKLTVVTPEFISIASEITSD